MIRRLSFLGLLVIVSACATARTPNPTGERTQYRVLAGRDLQLPNAEHALDLIRMQRPQFLESGGRAGIDRPLIFIDGIPTEDALELAAIPKGAVAEIRFLTASEASFKFGRGFQMGAIVVTLKHETGPIW